MIGSICNISCDGVWQNMIPGDGISSHYLVGMPIMILHDAQPTFTNVFCSPPTLGGGWGGVPYFPFFVLLNASVSSLRCLCIAFTIYRIMNFFSIIIAGDVLKVSVGVLFILFCFTFIIPSFYTLFEHKLVDDTLRLGFPIIVISRLVI